MTFIIIICGINLFFDIFMIFGSFSGYEDIGVKITNAIPFISSFILSFALMIIIASILDIEKKLKVNENEIKTLANNIKSIQDKLDQSDNSKEDIENDTNL